MNVFVRLHRWATRQDENFMTDAAATVLDLLLERQRPVGLRIIGLLSGGAIKVDLDDEPSVEVRTQIDTNEGRPDLELSGRGQLAVVEVKVESDARRGQLEGYRKWLQASGVPETKLVLLTRYPFVPGDGDELPDLALRWYEVADWFESELRQGSITDAACAFVCEQFLTFLEGRNIGHSSGELAAQGGEQGAAELHDDAPRGSQSLQTILPHQDEPRQCRLHARKRAILDWIGVG